MQAKNYNAYRITHKNGSIEDISALDLVQALENMETPETESKVVQAFLVKENVRTLIEGHKEVFFSAVVAEGGGGSIATPVSGKIHEGDQIALKAVPARTYEFVSWSMNGTVISLQADYLYTVPPLPEGIDTVVLTATFRLAPVNWSTLVEPAGAGSSGCMAFPTSGVVDANAELQLLAVEGDGWTFDHWERNGVSISTDKLLATTVAPLAEGEEACVYKAVFTD